MFQFQSNANVPKDSLIPEGYINFTVSDSIANPASSGGIDDAEIAGIVVGCIFGTALIVLVSEKVVFIYDHEHIISQLYNAYFFVGPTL